MVLPSLSLEFHMRHGPIFTLELLMGASLSLAAAKRTPEAIKFLSVSTTS
jgi:hypothetical protein